MRVLLQVIFISITTTLIGQNSDQWEQRADFGNFGRHRATGMGIGNKAYVGTGHLNGTGFDTWYCDWWEYDPATNAWTQKADYPAGNFAGDQDVVSLPMDTVGYAGLGQNWGTLFYKYSPTTNTWTQVASPPSNGDFNNTFPFRIGSYGYFPSLFSNNFFRYDAVNDTWLQLNPLPFTVNYGTPTFAIGDKGYIKDPQNGVSFYEYKPSLDTWTPREPFPGQYPNRPRGFSQYGYGFFIGGYLTYPEWDKQVWRFDPTTNTWDRLDDHPGSIRRWAVALNVHNRVFYGLGTNGTNFNDWWEFDMVANFDEVESDVSINIYPNPSTELINVRSEDTQQFEVYLFDIAGNEIRHEETNNGKVQIKRNGVSPGTYLCKVIRDNRIIRSEQVIFQ